MALSELLDFDDFIPTYATITDQQISKGVNYASGGAGILPETGSHLRLYTLGGRKIVLFGLAPIGCTPAEIYIFGTNGKRCVESINDAVKKFNDKLKPLVDELNHDIHDAKFTFINVSHISSLQQVIPWQNVPCCEVMVDGQCAHSTTTCPIRVLSIYYDGLHPTEMAHNIIARSSYIALSDLDASPYDISHLVRL
ncbi:hypothetical protein L1987_56796 [Smallanthus sonchifolius]|uniref:Uncharacterized protein n=1 Tax=Smallanthus sonchifolius TaxID=185202 RepID=A0ACB9DB61_9ASTR|nr:hypothetical protein L1987_56796 [Smallanthus sonchifolius]